jgi:hypothetical protein
MDIDTLANMIDDKYDLLISTRESLAIAEEKVTEAKAELDRAKLRGVMDGTIQGKNEQERAAKISEVCAEQLMTLEIKERQARICRYDFENAMNNVERVRALLRIEEIRVRTP